MPRAPLLRPGRVAAALCAVGVVAAVAGAALLASARPVAAVQPAGRTTVRRAEAPVVSSPAPAVGVPSQVTLAGRAAPIVPEGSQDGQLQLPASPDIAGWWSSGAAPDDGTGTVLLAGHLDTATGGVGIFSTLLRLPPGSTVTVTDSAGRTWPYTVTGRAVYPQDQLPASLFAAGGAPRLVLITCGGAFDPVTQHYSSNVAVYAEPAAA